MTDTTRKVNFLLTRTTLAHAVAGSIGSMAAMTLCYPLDRVRTIVQIDKEEKGNVVEILSRLVRQEGFLGIYRGLKPMLVALGTSNFVYFYWFVALKAGLERMRPKLLQLITGKTVSELGVSSALTPVENLVLASVAGTVNVFLTTPLWVVSTRMAVKSKKAQASGDAQKPRGMLSELIHLAKEEGVSGLWSGLGPSLILVSNPSVQFVAYERFKTALLRHKLGREPTVSAKVLDMEEDNTSTIGYEESKEIAETNFSSLEYLILGALAKMVATLVTYPLQVAQSKMRACANKAADKQKDKSDEEYKSTFDCLKKIFKQEGIRGLYKGMDAKLLQTCLTSAFMFAFYEKITKLIFSLILWKQFNKSTIQE